MLKITWSTLRQIFFSGLLGEVFGSREEGFPDRINQSLMSGWRKGRRREGVVNNMKDGTPVVCNFLSDLKNLTSIYLL